MIGEGDTSRAVRSTSVLQRAREEEAICVNCRGKDNVVGIRISRKRDSSERSLSQHGIALCEQRGNLYISDECAQSFVSRSVLQDARNFVC